MPSKLKPNFKIDPVVLVWFFLSGMAALIYQVIWARELELIFGSTLYAVSTILSVFMAGLALGSIIFGKLADRHPAPLKLYGLIELGIGVYALLTPSAFKLLSVIQQSLPDSLRAGGAGFNPFSFFFSFIILIVPTTCMGGTLPILSKAIIKSYRELGSKVSTLYFINTLGATAGAFLAGFVLIAAFGMITSTSIAALINVLIGGSAIWVHRLTANRTLGEDKLPGESGRESAGAASGAIPRRRAVVLLVGYGFAGFAALGLEVLWTRVLILVIGSSVYAFSLMLTAILMGIALGSLLGVKVVDRARNLWVWFAAVELALGLAVVVTVPVLGNAQLYFFDVFWNYSDSFGHLLLAEFGVIFLILMVPTTLMGLAFPVASKIYATDLKHLSSHIGDIYASNTIGAIIGPLAVSFLLIPGIGIQKAIMDMAYIYLAIGIAILIILYWRRKVVMVGAPLFLAAAVIGTSAALPSWNKLIITSGVFYQAYSFYDPSGARSPRDIMTSRDLLFYKEGQLATVSVMKGRGQKVLTINGKVDASSMADLGTQLLLAHMPVLLQKHPEKVLVVGLGSGITLGAILKHPEVKRVDQVEIEPAVVEAARFFDKENNHALTDPRTNIIVNDARNFIISSSEKYDVISAEPSNPWVSNSSTMFSKEVFELYKDRLNEDGVVMQWFHLYRMGNQDLRMIISTFRSVFPHTTLWGKANSPDIILIGSLKPLRIDYNELSARIAVDSVSVDLARIKSNNAFQMLNYFLMDEDSLARYAADYPPNTDDHPYLEFSAPKNLYASTVGVNLESMNGYRTSALAVLNEPSSPIIQAQIKMDFDAREKAIQAQIYREYGDWERAQKEWEDSLRINPNYMISRESLADLNEGWGEAALQSGDFKNAFYFFTRAAELSPQRASAHTGLGRTAEASGQPELALLQYSEAAKLSPDDTFVNYSLGTILSQLGQYEKAVDAFSRAIEEDPAYTYAYSKRGRAYERMGLPEAALLDYNTALNLDPNLAEAHVSRGLFYYQRWDYDRALADFGQAVDLNPTANNRDFRAIALMGMQRYEEALKDLDKANEIDPALPLPWFRRGFIYEKQGKKAEAIAAYQHFITLSDDAQMVAEAKLALGRLQ